MSDNVRPILDDLTTCWCGYLEQERNLNNVANADLQIAELQAEIARLRAGGCAREQTTTQYCGEMQSLIGRLTNLAEGWRTIQTYDKTADGVFEACADMLQKAVSWRMER